MEIFAEYVRYEHEPGVPADVAKALFQYHWQQGHIKPGTALIVGSHGEDLVKDAIQECLKERGMHSIAEKLSDGRRNEGCLIAMPFEATKAAIATPNIIVNSGPIPDHENGENAQSERTAPGVTTVLGATSDVSSQNEVISASAKRRRARSLAKRSANAQLPVTKPAERIPEPVSQIQAVINGLKTLWQGWSPRIWGR